MNFAKPNFYRQTLTHGLTYQNVHYNIGPKFFTSEFYFCDTRIQTQILRYHISNFHVQFQIHADTSVCIILVWPVCELMLSQNCLEYQPEFSLRKFPNNTYQRKYFGYILKMLQLQHEETVTVTLRIILHRSRGRNQSQGGHDQRLFI